MDVSEKPLLAVVADVHLGNFRDFGGTMLPSGLNRRGTLTLRTFGSALLRAEELDCMLVVAGDLFHHKKPEPAVIATAIQLLRGHHGKVKIIPGNHDTVDASAEGGNTACAPLAYDAHVLNNPDWSQPQTDTAVYFVPFDARRPMAEVLNDLKRYEAPFKQQALVTHVGVVDDDSAPWLRDSSDAIHKDKLFDLMDREGIVVAFVGNYHQHREWERGGKKIVQVGALNPTGFGDEGLEGYGGFAVWYGGTDVRWESIPGPRFVRLRADADSFLPNWPDGNVVFARADRGLEDHPGIVDREVTLWPAFAGVEFIDPEEPKPATTLELDHLIIEDAEQALIEYVDKMPLPEGVGKAEVLDKLRELWRKAA